MNKSLVLAALLLPFFGHGITKEARIKELKEAEYNKVLELQTLATQIRKVASQFYNHEEYDYFLEIAERKREQPEDLLRKSNMELHEKILNCLSQGKELHVNLPKELFYTDVAFDAYKSLFIESAIEKHLLMLLTEKLKKCFDEFVAIKKELKNLL